MMNGDQPKSDDLTTGSDLATQVTPNGTTENATEDVTTESVEQQPTAAAEAPPSPELQTMAVDLADSEAPPSPVTQDPGMMTEKSESTPAPDVESTGDAAVAPAVHAEAESAETIEKRRVQLNPTANPENYRAVGTYAIEGLAAPGGDAPAGSVVDITASYMQPPPSGPVELPQDATLEENLEAEINAAMQGTMTSPAPSSADSPEATPFTIPLTEDQLEPGAKLKAKVQSVTSENVFCDIGFRCPGLLPIKQFPPGKQPREGEEFLVIVDKFDSENGNVLISLPKATRRPRGNWEELAVGQIVECVVNKTNKGGLEVTVGNMRAFLPASQVDVGFISSLDPYVGQRLPVQITEVNPAKRNLVVSRRVLVIQERKELANEFWGKVEVGQQFTGTVKTLKDYGAFIDLGGVDGFLHVGEMSWTRIKHPSDLLQEGQSVEVVVLSLDREKHKIGLGMRQLAQNPWNVAVDKYAVGTTVSGRVTRTADFGAFVELEPGLEGLIHISELEHRRVKRVGEVLNVGQEVQAQVLEVSPERQRISLSLKALKEKPEEPKDEDLAPNKGQAYERKRKEPLRGGTGGNKGGGLFGNPTDFGN